MRRFALLTVIAIAFPAFAIQANKTGPVLPAPTPALLEIIGNTSENAVAWRPNSVFSSDKVWQSFNHSKSGRLSVAFGSPIQLTESDASESAIGKAALQFIEQNRERLGLGGSTPKIVENTRHGKLASITCAVEFNDILIEGAGLSLTLNNRNELMSIKSDGFGDAVTEPFLLDQSQVVKIAQNELATSSTITTIHQIYLPRLAEGASVLKPAWKIELSTSNHAYQPTLFIDGNSGEILAAENRVRFIDLSGSCSGGYFPLYHQQGESQIAYPESRLVIEQNEVFGDLEGLFETEANAENAPFDIFAPLEGRWIDVQEFDADSSSWQSQAIEANGDQPVETAIVWSDSNSTSDERNLYMQVNLIHSRFKEIEPDFRGMDYALLAVCGVGGPGWEDYEDNAFSSAQGLFFGRGNRADNFALYADIIYHEFGHSVTGVIYRAANLPYEGESGALNEGWSDYFSCSFTDEPFMGEGGLFGNGYIRNVNNNLIYPRDIRGEVHDDSRIISAAMWHTRQVLGESYSDSLFHFARYLHGNDFRKYFVDVLATDDNNGDLSDGTPNYRAIYEQFDRHGIGIGDLPYYRIFNISMSDDSSNGAAGNDNGLAEAGETFALTVDFFRAGAPVGDIGPIHVLLDSPSPDLEPIQWDYQTDNVPVGERAQTVEPLLTRVAANAQTGFVWLYITITAGGDDNGLRDSIRITIGRPPILLVRDGVNGVDRSSFYRSALDSLSLIYSECAKAEPFRPMNQIMSLYQTVIWFTGDDSADILDSADVALLESYLDEGGRLLLTGQFVAKNESSRDFLANRLGASFVTDSLSLRYAEGESGDPVGDSLKVLLQGGVGAGNQFRAAAIEPVGEGIGCFRWTRAAGRPFAAVRRDDPSGRYRTIFYSFGLEGVGGQRSSTQRQVMESSLAWLNTDLSVRNESSAPDRFRFSAVYPNPFNSSVRIAYTLQARTIVRLAVFDQQGRCVKLLSSGSRSEGAHEVYWDAADLSSGVYLLNLEACGRSVNRKLALVK